MTFTDLLVESDCSHWQKMILKHSKSAKLDHFYGCMLSSEKSSFNWTSFDMSQGHSDISKDTESDS